MVMNHYICTGSCGGVAQEEGTCQDSTCYKHDQLLEECTCSDAKHQTHASEGTTEDK